MRFRADLHIHSCLSPCASLEMSPRRIVALAAARGLNAIALADHHSARNVPALAVHAQRAGLAWLPALELATVEEAHILCLFDTLPQALRFGADVYAALPDTPNAPERTGDQAVVDADDTVEELVPRYLGGAVNWSFTEAQRRVEAAGGLFIPAHIDRPVFSVVSQLGFLPPGAYAGVEVSPFFRDAGRTASDSWQHLPCLGGSDAHTPDAIGSWWCEFEAETFDLAAIRRALAENRVRLPDARPSLNPPP